MRAYQVTDSPRRPPFDAGADDVRWLVLHTMFAGDAHAWVDYLLTQGSRRQVEEDLPFAIRVAIGGMSDAD